MLERREVHLTIDLCLRIGEVLLSNGAGAADVTATVQAVAYQLGLRNVETDVTFTSISMSHQRSPERSPVTMMRQVKHREIDYEDLTRVDHLVREILAGRTDLAEARSGISAIATSRHRTPRWVVTIALSVMCGSIAVMLGGTAAVVGIAAVSGAVIDRVQLVMQHRQLPTFFQQVVGGAAATLLAAGAVAINLHDDPSLAVTANIVMLLSGMGFMGTMQDAVTGFYLTASARMIEIALSTAGLLAGVSVGFAIAKALGIRGLGGRVVPRAGLEAETVTLVLVGAGITAAAFAVSAYAPWRVIPAIALVAGGAVLLSAVVTEAGFARTWAVGTAALLIGLLSFTAAGIARVPPLVIAVSTIVPLLPGLLIFRGLALLSAAGPATGRGMLALATAGSVALALAAGVILGEYLAQPLKREARRIEGRLAGPRMVGPLRARVGRKYRG